MQVAYHLENPPGSQRTGHIRIEYRPRARLVRIARWTLAKKLAVFLRESEYSRMVLDEFGSIYVSRVLLHRWNRVAMWDEIW